MLILKEHNTVRQMTNDELLYLLDQVVDTERQINAEIEARAQLDLHWPADIIVKAGHIYRGYTPVSVLSDKLTIDQEFLSGLDELL